MSDTPTPGIQVEAVLHFLVFVQSVYAFVSRDAFPLLGPCIHLVMETIQCSVQFWNLQGPGGQYPLPVSTVSIVP
jgi:hypothetical protein